ncbi:MAG: pro-sigmaK processing inhibitor BofA [Firmicutes bacterium]|nr:pro-sigmaK processing inhibitor BofA [Bacillota bacterium]
MADWVDWNLAAAIIFGLFILYFILRAFFKPLKIVFRVLLWTIAGGLAIFLYNLVGVGWGLAVGLNLISAFIVGMMGLPGLGALIVLKYLLV